MTTIDRDILNSFIKSDGSNVNIVSDVKFSGSVSFSQNDTLILIDKPITEAFIPTGGIIMWSGTQIPTNWALCDGTNNTPNLVGRFVMGFSETYPYNTTGGFSTQTLSFSNMPVHKHVGNTDPNESHNHGGFTTGSGINGGEHYHNISLDFGNTNNIGFEKPSADSETWQGSLESSGYNTTESGSGHVHVISDINTEHKHSFVTTSTGNSTPFSIIPPYYALAFIMKLPV